MLQRGGRIELGVPFVGAAGEIHQFAFMPHEQAHGGRNDLAVTFDSRMRVLDTLACGVHVLLGIGQLLADIVRILRRLQRLLQLPAVVLELGQLGFPAFEVFIKMHLGDHELRLVSERIEHPLEVCGVAIGKMLLPAAQLADIVEHAQFVASKTANRHAAVAGDLHIAPSVFGIRGQQRVRICEFAEVLHVIPTIHHRRVPTGESGMTPSTRLVGLDQRLVRRLRRLTFRITHAVHLRRPACDTDGMTLLRRDLQRDRQRGELVVVQRIDQRAEPNRPFQAETTFRVGDHRARDRHVIAVHQSKKLRIHAIGRGERGHLRGLLESSVRGMGGQQVHLFGRKFTYRPFGTHHVVISQERSSNIVIHLVFQEFTGQRLRREHNRTYRRSIFT